MVRYILYNKLTSVQEGDALPEGAGLVTVLTSSEYEELFHETGHYRIGNAGDQLFSKPLEYPGTCIFLNPL